MSVLIYFIVHCFLQQEICVHAFLNGLHDFNALGNPTWFILMTLITYIFTYASFKVWGEKHLVSFVVTLTVLLLIFMHIVYMLKPIHWINTILCFPAGMLYFLKGEKIEQMFKKIKIPSIVYASLFLLIGVLVYRTGATPAIYVQNAGSIIFAVGVTWFVGSFTWENPSRFLVWLGSSGLFFVYMFHLLPMRIMTQLELNYGNPYLVWLAITVSTIILVLAATSIFDKVNKVLFYK